MENNLLYKKLILKLNNSIETYNDKLKTFIPSPNETDFKRGYIVRYFTQKANDESAPIFEVDKLLYSDLKENAFYKTISLDWKITGDLEKIREANSKSVKFASKNFKAIEFHLPNKIQFHKK